MVGHLAVACPVGVDHLGEQSQLVRCGQAGDGDLGGHHQAEPGGLHDVVMVGGGAQVYRDAIALATEQILTEVHLEPDGDTHYPDFAEAEWRETRREGHLENDPPYEIRWLERL